MVMSVTDEEVKAAVFAMYMEKTPGIDGLNSAFFQTLKLCLKCIISDKHSAFIKGRLLIDNALIAFEVNHFIKRKTRGKNGVAELKIDVSKAYDRLEWSFNKKMLNKFGFHDKWVDKVMTCVKTVSYRFLHNGDVFAEMFPR
ncbi:uncharacterized protein LOC141719547 [Apium graveolens]|uniref:uncharacterized protein LOC141719547 n=1 Tax=Apium graveolens TaxID=4045 RepID=UPI003D7BD2F8